MHGDPPGVVILGVSLSYHRQCVNEDRGAGGHVERLHAAGAGVMAGLGASRAKDVDARDKRGHDD
jgi:hypothetical protein